jgi:uncharacterized protein (TIGR03000 family)
MFKRWFPVVSVGVLVLLLTSSGAGHAQAPALPGASYISPAYTNNYGYIYPSTFNMWMYPSSAASGMDRRPYFGSLAPAAYGVPSSVAAMPITYIAYYPPVFTDRAPVAAPAVGITQADDSATVEVSVPAGAELWFDGRKTVQTGTQRTFMTPVLEKGSSYHYEVRASWIRDGQRVEETRSVPVTAGGRVSVTFPTPPSR